MWSVVAAAQEDVWEDEDPEGVVTSDSALRVDPNSKTAQASTVKVAVPVAEGTTQEEEREEDGGVRALGRREMAQWGRLGHKW